MRIQCKIKRKGGTTVTMGDKAYEFLPDEQGRHVAVIEDEAHIQRFLAVRAYEAIDSEPPGEPEPSGETKGEGEPGATLTPNANQGEDQTQGGGDNSQDDALKAARDAYVDKFGKAPHHAMKAETILERVEAGEP